jgi:hypothetical protein
MNRHTAIRPFLFGSLTALVVLALVAAPAAAKEGGIARLDTPLPGSAEPGSTITVSWTLESFVNDNGDMGPFSAGGAYVKLIGLDVSEAIGRETSPGHYVADVVVPRGGIQAAEFGIAGESTMNGVSQRSDLVFMFEGVLIDQSAPAPVVPSENSPASNPQPASSPSINPLLILGALALVLAGIGTVLTIRRRGAIA